MRIPQTEARRQLDPGGVRPARVVDAIGPSLRSVGGQISALGEATVRQEETSQNMAARQGFLEFQNQIDADYRQSVQDMPEGAQGHYDSWFVGIEGQPARFQQSAAEFISTLPPRLQAEYQARLTAFEGDFTNRVASDELQERQRFATDVIERQVQAASLTVSQDPSQLDAQITDIVGMVNGSGLPRATTGAMARAVQEQLAMIAAQGEIGRDPEGFRQRLDGYLEAFQSPIGGRNSSQLVQAALRVEEEFGFSAESMLAIMSYETGGTLDPWQRGSRETRHGEHRGLIQWGEEQRERYGVTENSTIEEQVMAAARYMRDNGVQPGDDIVRMYASVLTGDADRTDGVGDIAAGGVARSARHAVQTQFPGHIDRARSMLGQYGGAQVPNLDANFRPVAVHDGVNLTDMRPDVVDAATIAGQLFGQPLPITSGYRSQARQDEIRAQGDPNRSTVAQRSNHTAGTAIDIATRNMSQEEQARLVGALVDAGFTGIGQYDGHIHADFRQTVPRTFGERDGSYWGGWTSLSPEVFAVLQERGFAPGVSASLIARAGTGAYELDPILARMGPGQIIQLPGMIDARTDALQAAQTQELATIKDDFNLRIATGDVTLTEDDILSSPLDSGDQASLIRSFRSANGDRRETAAYVSMLQEGGQFDPFDRGDQQGVSRAYDSIVNDRSVMRDADAQGVAQLVYERSGIVPQRVHNELRQAARSTDPQMIATAGQIALNFQTIDPGGLTARAGGSEIERLATQFGNLTRRGYSGQEAGEIIAALNDPQQAARREAVLDSEPVRSALSGIDEAQVLNVFDAGIFDVLPPSQLGETAEATAVMVGEYQSILREEFVRANGDQELAEELANQRFRSIYGASDLTLAGGRTVTRYPPETVYQPVDGSHDYIREQLIEALAAEEGEFGDDVRLQYTGMTEAAVQAGQPAPYDVWYRNEDGVWELFQHPFVASYEAAQERFAEENLSESVERRDDLRDTFDSVEEYNRWLEERGQDMRPNTPPSFQDNNAIGP